MTTLALLPARPGVTQDHLADLAADLNARAARGEPMPVTHTVGQPAMWIVRAWVERDVLMCEAEEGER